MFDFNAMAEGLAMFASLSVVLLCVLGTAVGLVAGALPGITGSIAIAVFLPITFWWLPLEGLAFTLGIFTGALFGGSVPAILINAPGTPASAATPIDGYPMTKKGLAGQALGIALISSCVGCFIGLALLTVVIVPLGRFALMFGPWEMLFVAILGFTIVISLNSESFSKGALATLLGLLLGTIGTAVTGARRGTFGLEDLEVGLPTIPILIGLLAFSELFALITQTSLVRPELRATERPSVALILKSGIEQVLRHPVTFLRSTAIGIIVGAVPAAGATIATILSYNQAVNLARDKRGFGEGRVEGLVAAEAANSSSEAGSLATLLALGIPGGAVAAVLAGAFLMYGLPLGPRLVSSETALVYGILLAEMFQILLLLVLGAIFSAYATKIIGIPMKLLVPTVLVLVLIGPYVTQEQLFDSFLVVIFGVLGWLLKRNGYPVLAVLLGVILAPIIDQEIVRIGILYDYDPRTLLTRPVGMTLIVLIFFSLCMPYLGRWSRTLARRLRPRER